MMKRRIPRFIVLVSLIACASSWTFGQAPTYKLILQNDSLASSTVYEFDAVIQKTGSNTLELSAAQLIFTFNTLMSDSLTFTVVPGSSQLTATEQPTNGKLSISGNELRVAPNPPPGSGSGTIVPNPPGVRIARFRLTSPHAFAGVTANVNWKDSGANPVTKINAYVAGLDTNITDTTKHSSTLTNPLLAPLTITTLSPLPSGTAGIAVSDTLTVSGGRPPYVWTVSAGTLPAGTSLSTVGVLSGTPTTAGTANFTVQVTDSTLAATVKALAWTIAPGAAYKLAFVQQPSNGVAGAVISPAVTVQVKDSLGNNVAVAGDTVTMSLASGTGTLLGTLQNVTGATGLATFANLTVDQGGVKSLLASSTGLQATTSSTFTLSTYTITASSGPNGSIAPSGAVSAISGGSQAFTITPNTGYHIDSVLVDGVNQGAVASYTFNAIAADHTIRSVFAINQYTISATAGSNGSIVPSGAVNVAHGSSQLFTFTPATGYHVDSLIVDGTPQAAAPSYTFTNVTAAHTIRVTFAINQYTITATPGPNGSIAPPGTTIVSYGGSQLFTFTPNTGYHVDSILVDGVSQGAAASYTLTNVTADHSIRVAFAINQFTITATAGLHGTISPSGAVAVSYGSNQTFTIAPATGYHVDSLVVDGTNQAAAGSYQFTNVTAPHTIRVTFAPNSISVTVQTAPAGLQIIVDGVTTTAPHTYSWTAAQSHTLSVVDSTAASGTRTVWNSWSDGAAKSHTVTPLVDSTFTASFTTQYFLTMAANTGGSVAPPSGWYDAAASVQITATPLSNYNFTSWSGSGNGSTNSNSSPATVTMNGPISETANFARKPIQITAQAFPLGRLFQLDGFTYSSPQTITVTPGTPHFLDIFFPTQADTAPGKQYVWSQWSDGGAKTHTITPDTSTTYTATFTTQFFLTTAAGTGGSAAPPSAWYDTASVVQLTATPNSGYSFSGWKGKGPGSYSGPSNPVSVTMNGAVFDTATFTQFPVSVTIQSSPAGRTGVIDGVPTTLPQTFVWTSLSSHTIAVTDSQVSGGTRYLYRSWSDGGAKSHTVAPATNSTYTVSFSSQYFLTTAVDSGGTVTPASAWFDSGAVQQITATSNSGFTFNNWTGTGTGSFTGTTNPANVTMLSPITETAHFGRFTANVTIQTSPPGLSIIVDTVTYTAPQVFHWTTGSSHTISTTSIQSGSLGTRYVWSAWSDAGAITHSVSPTGDGTLTATFGTEYFITMSANPGGTVTPASNWFPAGQAVVIRATPDTGYYFDNWQGTGTSAYSGPANPANIIVNGPASEVGNFKRNPVQITIQTNPPGRAYFFDGVSRTVPYTTFVDPLTQHYLDAATPQPGASGTQYVFHDWSDGGAKFHSIFPDSNTVYTVTFTTQYMLTLTAGPGGTVSPPSDWNDSGKTVPITATPAFSYSFTGWKGSGSGSYTGPNNPANVVMNGPIFDTASFSQFPVNVTIQSNPGGLAFTVDGVPDSNQQTYTWTSGTSHTLSAPDTIFAGAGTRYIWSSWSDGGARSHSIIPTRDSVITVNYRTQHFLTMNAGSGGTVSPASGWHDRGSVVGITATPNATFLFGGWNGTGAGSFTGPTNPASVTVNGPITESGSFVHIPVYVTIQSLPAGTAYLVDSVTYGKTQTFTWDQASSHTISAISPQSAGMGVRYIWRNWSDSGASSHAVLASKDTTLTVQYGLQYYLTTSVDSGGTVIPPSGWLDSGAVVQLRATASPGFVFLDWNGTGPGEYTGPINPVTITMNGPIFQTASFGRFGASVTVTSNPPGLNFRVDDTLYTGSKTFNWITGSRHKLAGVDSQQVAPDKRYRWNTWSDGGQKTHTITVAGDSTIVARHSPQFFLTMAANVGGTVQPASEWVDSNGTVMITGIADSAYSFARWTGTGIGSFNGTINPVQITMGGPITQTASFRQNPVTVTVRTVPNGKSFMFDGVTYTTQQSFSVNPGEQHQVSATSPQPGGAGTQYAFDNWSDGGAQLHNVFSTTDTSFVVTFKLQYALTVNVNPASAGAVNPTGTTYADSGSIVDVLATPSPGFAFSSWSGDTVSSANPIGIVMSGPKSITANFLGGINVTLQSVPAGRSVTADGTTYTAPKVLLWVKGSTHTISVPSPQPGTAGIQYRWGSWSDSGAVTHSVSPSNDTVFTSQFQTDYYLTMNHTAGGTASPASGWLPKDTTVTIRASADSGYILNDWTGTGSGSYTGPNDSATITMLGPVTETATFGILLPPPVLSGIPDSSTGVVTTPLFGWEQYGGASSYRLQVSKDPSFAATVFDSSNVTDTTLPAGPLGNALRYFWRVRAKVGSNSTPFSPSRTFTTAGATVSVISPLVNWGTGHRYSVRWNNSGLSGPVNFKLSVNNGVTFMAVQDSLPNAGSYPWLIPDSARYLGALCRILIESVLNPAITAQSSPFAIVQGNLSSHVTVSTTIPYSAEPYASTDYRLVSMPGIVDSIRVGSLLTGQQKSDWRMFSDNGANADYLVEMTATSRLTTGMGYWLDHKGNLAIPSFNMTMPPLTLDATFAIPLHDGFNIIANPFDKRVPWSAVLDANPITADSALSSYNKAYQSSLTMDPFQGYYFFNRDHLSSLAIPYPFGTTLPSADPAAVSRQEGDWAVRIGVQSDLNADPENYFGISSRAKAGQDALDRHKPPLFLDQTFLYFQRKEWDPEYPRFSTDFRPALGAGQTWEFAVSAPRGGSIRLDASGIESVPPEAEIVLVNGMNTVPVDLRRQSSVSFRAVSATMPFRIIAGTHAYIEGELAKLLPASIELTENFPNPFNPSTTISLKLPQTANVSVEVFNLLGQRVRTLAHGTLDAGIHTFLWDATDESNRPVAGGVYFCRLVSDGRMVRTQKMLYIK